MTTKDIAYIGVDDHTLDLFENQFPVPDGISYNSYVILDEKVAILDTVDRRATDEFLSNLANVLGERTPDYLIIHHMEPDHSASIHALLEKYPNIRLVGSAMTFQILPLYFPGLDLSQAITVKEGDILSLGRHQLTFLAAPMVHWPEVIMTYDKQDRILFTADAFGRFGTLDTDGEWVPEARRYYFNIVGKYGPQVQALLKKVTELDIQMICPLHGPILRENLAHFLDLYDTWSSYRPEAKGVFIAYASIHHHTAEAARKLAELLIENGCPEVYLADLNREDLSTCLANAFRYDRLVLAASSYNTGTLPAMEDFLRRLKGKSFQKRTVALIENSTWAPGSVRTMKELLSQMNEITIVEPTVTIRGVLKDSDLTGLVAIAKALG